MIALSAITWPYKLAGTVIVLGLIGWGIHTYNEHLREQGRAEIQVKFDAYRAAVSKLATERETANAIKAAQVAATNEVTVNAYQNQLAAIAADRDSLSRRLRNSQARASCVTVPTPADQPGIADPSPQPSGIQAIDGLTDDFARACLSDAIQLDTLIQQLKPQLAF